MTRIDAPLTVSIRVRPDDLAGGEAAGRDVVGQDRLELRRVVGERVERRLRHLRERGVRRREHGERPFDSVSASPAFCTSPTSVENCGSDAATCTIVLSDWALDGAATGIAARTATQRTTNVRFMSLSFGVGTGARSTEGGPPRLQRPRARLPPGSVGPVAETPYERVVRFMREQPAGAMVPFHEDAISTACPISFNYADERPPAISTRGSPSYRLEEPTADPMDMHQPYDATLRVSYDGDVRAIRIVPDTGARRRRRGHRLPGVRARVVGLVARPPRAGRRGPVAPARLDALRDDETALANWSARHAGRDDLRFAFDPTPSASLRRSARPG